MGVAGGIRCMLTPMSSPRIDAHSPILASDNLAAVSSRGKSRGLVRAFAYVLVLAGLALWSASPPGRPQAVLYPARLPRMVVPPSSTWGITLSTSPVQSD